MKGFARLGETKIDYQINIQIKEQSIFRPYSETPWPCLGG